MVRTTKIFVALVLMVAGCGSPPSTLNSAASPGPTGQASVPSAASTTTQPGAGFWSEVVAPDGTVYALAREPKHGGASSAIVLAITADGTVRYRATIVAP